jgi:hypothetical protein
MSNYFLFIASRASHTNEAALFALSLRHHVRPQNPPQKSRQKIRSGSLQPSELPTNASRNYVSPPSSASFTSVRFKCSPSSAVSLLPTLSRFPNGKLFVLRRLFSLVSAFLFAFPLVSRVSRWSLIFFDGFPGPHVRIALINSKNSYPLNTCAVPVCVLVVFGSLPFLIFLASSVLSLQ